ncbi:MAG: alpha/beta hydrolase [Bacteroidales bacterium]|jgi:pimeloyl-ACP methyl ester carboxylesterase|nr:alpha/beta hydrolase [Bacteroidales bacterium]
MKKLILIAFILLSFSCSRDIKDFYNTDDNNKMYYESYGSGETAIVFIHGWSVNCRSWDEQIDFFKDKYKVILVDLPGFGKSEHNRQDWSMQHYGKDVAGLCRDLELKNVYLVGWSMGTAVVVEAAVILGNEAKAVITVDQLWQTENDSDITWAEGWFDTEASRYKDFNALNNAYTNDSTLTVRLIGMMPPGDSMPEWWEPSVTSFFKWSATDLKSSVSALKIPVRAINGSWVNTDEEQWKSLYSDYKLTVFENSNHFLVWQYPQKFNETLFRIIVETSDLSE